MNIEIANRLVNLRKQKGFSQEELAEKLGLSRQAVSKWERAEASPDTDNLICLAKLYGVSLDELLKTDQTLNDIVEENPVEETKTEESGKKKTSVHIGIDGIHVVDRGDEVHIGPSGIHVADGHDNVHIGPGGIHIGEKKHLKGVKFREAFSAVFGVLVTVAYIFIGIFIGWHPWWLIFLAIPLVTSLIDCFIYKRITKFAYPVLVVGAYLLIGFLFNGWHPWWVLFLTIPVFYIMFRPIEKLWLKDCCVDVEVDSTDEDDDDDDEDEDEKDDDDDEDGHKKDKEINITIETEEKKHS